MDKSIVFMGSPKFALPALEDLNTTFPGTIKAVFTQPDRPKGRGKKNQPTIIKSWALMNDIPVYEPTNKEQLTQQLAHINPDIVIVIAYGMILPKNVTDAYYCINAHGSLLPKYRGPSPIHAAIMNGNKKTGISLIRMNEKMDEGNILAQESVPLRIEDTLETLYNMLAELAAKMLLQFLKDTPDLWAEEGIKQNHEKASYCHKLSSKDRTIDILDEPITTYRRIKAFSPTPGCTFLTGKTRIKIIDARFEDNQVIPSVVQPEGKKPMTYNAYLQGHPEGIQLC